jgi:hypothetical protein
VFKLRRMTFRQVVQRRQMKEEDSRNNCQGRGSHQIIKIIGRDIIYIICLCLCGIHPLICLAILQLLILILDVGLHIIEGCQVVLLIDIFNLPPRCDNMVN